MCRLSGVGQVSQLQQLTRLLDVHLDGNPLATALPASLYRAAALVVTAPGLAFLDGRQVCLLLITFASASAPQSSCCRCSCCWHQVLQSGATHEFSQTRVWLTCAAYYVIQSMMKIGVLILKMLASGRQGLLNPNLQSKSAFKVEKRPLGWHVAAHVHEIPADSTAVQSA